MMQWLLPALGIIMEVCGTTCMKLSDGFSNSGPLSLNLRLPGNRIYHLYPCLKDL